jgi:hypothetical protein
MARLRIKYVWEDVDRHGNVRRYFVRTGQKKIRLRAAPGTREFADEYEKALKADPDKVTLEKTSRSSAARGSLRWLLSNTTGHLNSKGSIRAHKKPDAAYWIH